MQHQDISAEIDAVDWSVGPKIWEQEEIDKLILEMASRHMQGVKELKDLKIDEMSGFGGSRTFFVIN
jgi:hypothetical protein